ncbi:heavy metal sensor histidine kinase [Aliamphritea ceti]|uniref:heavy metal sensor histidine kinase n=1 Tax=Aliamphritea ceti TaxID=1524258 RepID=UPI0021C27176|nr:heavy metal sensor histidine kinase [Aliamphritea ceti]
MNNTNRPISLTLRTLIFASIAISVSLLVTALLIMSSVRYHFIEQDIDELKVIKKSIERVLKQNKDPNKLTNELMHAVSGHHSVYYRVKSESNNFTFNSSKISFHQNSMHLSPSNTTKSEDLHVWNYNDITLRGIVTKVNIGDTSYRITIATDMELHLEFLKKLKRSLWLVMIGTGIATIFMTWFGIRRGLIPLRKLSNNMSKVKANHLNLSIDIDTVPIELQELTESFNLMITRLEEGVERLTHFSSDIAHELRTPLTNLTTQIQVTLSKARSSDIYLDLLYSNLEELNRLNKMVNEMLWLAKSDNELVNLDTECLNLLTETEEICDFYSVLAEDKNITINITGDSVFVFGDKLLLKQAISNLLSNAINYSPPEENISIKIESDEENIAKIQISNTSYCVSNNDLKKLFNKFYRVSSDSNENKQGAGLGLSITRSVFKTHDGNIEASLKNNTITFEAKIPRNR